jgi:hypothetical protein
MAGNQTWWTFSVAVGDCTIEQCGVGANLHFADARWDVRTGRWYQLTAVYDVPRRTISLYVDGASADVEHAFPIPSSRNPLAVGEGSGAYSGSDQFVGAVTALRTYGRALSPAEVWELYRAEIG